MLTTSLSMIRDAYAGHYAVPAINTQGGTYDIIRAICLAAEETRSPVILAHYRNTGEYSGHDWFVNTAKWMAEKVSVPVAIHLDHGDSFETCCDMLKLGFTSIMYDGSALPLEENAAATEEIARVCHAFGVPLESEIGELARLDAGTASSDASGPGDQGAVSPDDVRRYLQLCHPDFLAIGIGNAHGFYKSTPHIRLDVLEACRSFTDIPFVLHGCTGMSDFQVRGAIERGVAKINFGTQIRSQYLHYLKEGLETGKDGGHAWKLSAFTEQQLRQDVKAIIHLAGSAGKA